MPNRDDLCAAFPWVREAYLLGPDAASPTDGPTDLLVVCRAAPRTVAHGERARLLAEAETRTGRRLALRLASAAQVSRWLSHEARFAAAFRAARRLCP